MWLPSYVSVSGDLAAVGLLPEVRGYRSFNSFVVTFERPAECSSTRHLTGQTNGVFYDGEVNGITLSPTGLFFCVSVFGWRSYHLTVHTPHLSSREERWILSNIPKDTFPW